MAWSRAVSLTIEPVNTQRTPGVPDPPRSALARVTRGKVDRMKGEGLHRRTFLGAAAVAAVGAAAGCTGGPPAPARPTPGSTSRSSLAGPERDLAGDPWFWVDSVGPDDDIAGFTDRTSVVPGQSFNLHVSTTGSSFQVF